MWTAVWMTIRMAEHVDCGMNGSVPGRMYGMTDDRVDGSMDGGMDGSVDGKIILRVSL